MTVCVTGAAGFIGSHLVEKLLKNKYQVIGIDNFDPYYTDTLKKENIERFKKDKNFVFFETDVQNQENLGLIFSKHKISHIFHLAGRGGMKPSVSLPFVYLNNIVGGTLSILEVARKNNIQFFINASSSSVYGRSTVFPYTETLPTDQPTAPYAAFKKTSELISFSYHNLYGISVVNFRLFSVYGPRGRPDQIIYKFTEQIINKKPITWYKPEPMRDFTYVDDIVDGLISVLSISKPTYQILNLASGKPYPLSAVIKYIEKNLKMKAIFDKKIITPPVSDFPKTYADISSAKKFLGWKPKVSLEKGIELFINWYVKNK